MRSKRFVWARFGAVLTLGLAVLVASCGDDGDDALTRQEWLTEAEAICGAMNEATLVIPEPQTPEEIGEAAAASVEIARRGMDDLRALVPPPGDEEQVGEILDAFGTFIDTGEEWGQAASVNPESGEATTLFVELDLADERAQALAHDYGLRGCFAEGT